jgi:EAL domain-containing protein (putative c-di-GMP-specific phosphodiesterase class I)
MLAAPIPPGRTDPGACVSDDRRHLLVVDDEPIQRLLVTRAVESLGFAVDGAADLDEAAALLARTPYEAVVLDLSLGATEGVSLLHTLHGHGHGGDPLVVLMSGMDARVRAASYRMADALGVRVAGALEKPIVPARLRALLRDVPRQKDPAQVSRAPMPTAAELEVALDQHAILVEYQPQVRLSDGTVVGFEALARWRPASMPEPVSPELFVPLAERHGLIVPLTRQVLEASLAACRRWRRQFPDCGVAVNISPLLLANPALPDEIETTLARAGVPPGALVAEITESAVISDPLLATEVVTRLRIKGVRLSIDDFGTGHSSLLSLMRLPFTELKIDKSFIADCEADAEAWKIVRATISLAHELGLQVVAEGIETASVEERLLGAGCDIGQGWQFGRSMTEEALAAWFEGRAEVVSDTA